MAKKARKKAKAVELTSDPTTWADALDFKKLTPAQARVRVAKEVQKYIHQGVWAAQKMCYMVNFESLNKECTGCAQGALMYTAFRVFDGSADVFIKQHAEEQGVGFDTIVKSLRRLFDARTLKDIERAFEGWEDGDRDGAASGHPWVLYNPNTDDRLHAIMQNLIDHKGKFVIEDIYVIEE